MTSIRKRGERWHVQIRRQGTSSISKSFTTKTDAKAWALQTEALVESGKYQKAAHDFKTLECLLIKYRDEISLKKKGVSSETYRINHMLTSSITKKPITELSPSLFAVYRDKRLRLVSPSSVRRELVILRHCLSTAINEWNTPISENPIFRIAIPKENKQRTRRVGHEELNCLLAGCSHSYLRLAIELAIETGMRRGELLNAKWEHIDRGKRLLHIPETKTGHSRAIPLSSKAIRVIEASENQQQEHILAISANALRLAWERLCKRCNIRNLRFHDLRHEAISRFFELGLSIPEVQLISGHRDVRMLMRYTHLKPEDVGLKLN